MKGTFITLFFLLLWGGSSAQEPLHNAGAMVLHQGTQMGLYSDLINNATL